MSGLPSISEETRRAIETQLRTVEELDVLLLLGREPGRYWSSTAAAEATGLPPRVTADVLEVLASRNLLDVRLGETVRYRFDPPVLETRTAAHAILEAGWRQRDAVRRIIRGGARPMPPTPSARID